MSEIRNRRLVGAGYEQIAGSYLAGQGLRVLVRNYRCKKGEIDLIVRDNDTIVFVEVKYRRDSSLGFPCESVDIRKQRRIRAAAQWYLCMCHDDGTTPCRFDVISILGNRIHWIKDAF